MKSRAVCAIISSEANMRIGIVTAMAQETLPIYTKFGKIVDEGRIAGAVVYHVQSEDDDIYIAQSGVGEIRAAITTQMLVDIFEIEAVLNFGFVGAISSGLGVGDVVIANKVVHHQFDTSEVDGAPVGQYDGRDGIFFHLNEKIIEKVQSLLPHPLREVTVASGDKFIGNSSDKLRLKELGADICEMECAGIAMTAERNNIPFFSLKVISDSADESAQVSFDEVVARGLVGLDLLFPAILCAVTGKKEKSLPPVKKENE